MASEARIAFLSDLQAMEHSLDLPSVLANDHVSMYLRKGLMVAAFNTLEGFLAQRWVEVSKILNSSVLHFSDLPEASQSAILRRTLDNAASALRWEPREDIRAQREFFEALGNSLARPTGGVTMHALFGRWKGSNITVDDIPNILKILGVAKGWDALDRVVSSLLHPSPAITSTNASQISRAGIRDDFVTLCSARNRAAHEPKGAPTQIELRTFAPLIRNLAISYDIVLSIAAINIAQGNFRGADTPSEFRADKISCFTVKQRERDFAYRRFGATNKALRVSQDGDELFNSVALNSDRGTLLLLEDRSGKVINWHIAEA